MKINKPLVINIVGAIAIIFAIVFPEPSAITTWGTMFDSIVFYLSNPYLIFTTIVGLYGYITNL